MNNSLCTLNQRKHTPVCDLSHMTRLHLHGSIVIVQQVSNVGLSVWGNFGLQHDHVAHVNPQEPFLFLTLHLRDLT